MEITGRSIIGRLVALMLLACVVASHAQVRTTHDTFARDQQELAKVEKAWTDALQRGDAAALGKILADDYTMVDPVGITISKSEALQQIQSGNLKFDSFAVSDLKYRVFQGGAVITGKSVTKGKFKGKDISGEQRFVDVFEFRKGAWQAVYTQLTEVPTEKKATAPQSNKK